MVATVGFSIFCGIFLSVVSGFCFSSAISLYKGGDRGAGNIGLFFAVLTALTSSILSFFAGYVS